MLKPEDTFNPVLQRYYQAVHTRALEPGAPIPALDPAIEKYVTPDEALFKNAKVGVSDFKNNFKLKKNGIVSELGVGWFAALVHSHA